MRFLMYSIEYTEESLTDLEHFRKSERQLILDGVDRQLIYEPAIETKSRKRLRPNQLAEWELRIGKYRVFYDVIEADDLARVKIAAVGFKGHNRLVIRGKEFKL